MNLQARGVCKGLTIEEYIVLYCIHHTKKTRIQVPVTIIQSLSLKVIVLVLSRIAGLASLHQDSWPLMFYSVECMRPMVYDWSTLLLRTMKQQLTECMLCQIKNFGYANILSTFIFERVSSLIPRVEVTPHSLQDST